MFELRRALLEREEKETKKMGMDAIVGVDFDKGENYRKVKG
jgi:uncharacterized protein YbjQ (UPF0145 family)